MQGYIKLHREIKAWQWYTTANMVQFLVHCLVTANHKKKVWNGIAINRGQFLSSRASISKETGLTVQQVRTCESRMIKCLELTIKTTNKYSLYTVEKYNKFQTQEAVATSNVTNEQQTNNKRTTTTKNVKKDKNVKKRGKPLNLNNVTFEDLENWRSAKGYIFTIDMNLELEKCKNHFGGQTKYIGTAYNWIMRAQEYFNQNQGTKNGRTKLTGSEWARQQKLNK